MTWRCSISRWRRTCSLLALILASVALVSVACGPGAVNPGPDIGAGLVESGSLLPPGAIGEASTNPSVGVAGSTSASASSAEDVSGQLSVFRQLNPTGPKDVNSRDFHQLLGRDSIMPIYDPSVVDVEATKLQPEELVIGVSVGGHSRAYPIRTLRFREMVNDDLGGIPILVTW